MTNATTEERRIYVASLSDYNAGRLHGRWIDATQDADDIMAEVAEMLEESPEMLAEEWAIHDFEGFEGIRLHESESFERVSELANLLDEHGEAYAGYLDHVGEEYADKDGFRDAYRGCWDNEEAYAWDFIENVDLLGGLPEIVARYFDMNAYARDLFIDDVFGVRLSEGLHVYVRV